jgi:predicted kinase
VLARALAPRLGPMPGAVVLRSDVERKAMFGIAEAEPLPPQAYAPPITARVYATIVDKARRAVAAGHSAIVDAVFARPDERAVVERSAAILGVPFRGLFLEAALATRIARSTTRSRDASDADAQVARAQERYDLGDLTWTRIDASGTPDATLRLATAALR